MASQKRHEAITAMIKAHGEDSAIAAMIKAHDEDPEMLAWMQTPEYKKVHEESLRMTRQEMINSIIDSIIEIITASTVGKND